MKIIQKLVAIPGIYVDSVVVGTEEENMQCLGRNAKACKGLLHLLCGKGDGVFVVVSGTVGAAVH